MWQQKVQEPERKWVGEKSQKERSFLKLRPTVQWTSWSSAAPCLAEQRKDRGKLRIFKIIWVLPIKTQCVFLLFFLTLQSFTYIILFIKSFMYVFHTVFKRSEEPSPGHILTSFLILLWNNQVDLFIFTLLHWVFFYLPFKVNF